MSKTYYEVLGVPRNAGELEIKAAYHRLARKYHPDKAASPAEATSMEKEFSEISTAYNVLKDREKRNAYDQSLEAKRQQDGSKSGPLPKAGPSTAAAGSAAAGSAANEKNRANVAKRAYIKGAQLVTSGDFMRASEFFEVAIKNNDEEALYHAKLAQTLLRSQRSFSRATEAAQRAIELDPYNSDYRLILAELYENAGSTSMAVKTYEEILKWDPVNEKAIMALSVLAPKKLSLLGRLLGKKK
ncbi:MAG: DnaJ domain-containing protein [Candidatus Sumerlaeaceae bacterium]